MQPHTSSSTDIVPLDSGYLGECKRLLSAYPYKPNYYYPFILNEALTDYMLDQLTNLVKKESTWCFVIRVDGYTKGLMVCGKRAWETDVLGIEAGFVGPLIVDEIDLNSDRLRHILLEYALDWLRRQGILHITARLDVNEVKFLHLLEEVGFITVDGILHFSFDLRREGISLTAVDPPSEIHCRLHRETDIPQLRNIAERALVYDRFHSDPLIDPTIADQAYAQWIENSCHGLDDAVMVAIYENEPVGFMTLKINQRTKRFLGVTVGKIWLVAVAEHMRGQGVGQQLMYHSLQWFFQNEVDIVEVGTQFRNALGLKFYSRFGFVPINPVLALRKMLRK